MVEYGVTDPRQDRINTRDQIVWYCRHARQSRVEVEALPVSEFHASRRSLGELLSKEWDTGD